MFLARIITISTCEVFDNYRTSFERIYRSEQDVKTKERMLLVLNVAYHGMVAAHVARDLHRCKAWASNWLKRYDKEGIEGLRIGQKVADTHRYLNRQSYRIKSNSKGEQPGLDHKAG